MTKVVGVRFKQAGKIYYFDPGELTLVPGSQVMVETVRGIEYGQVMVGPREVARQRGHPAPQARFAPGHARGPGPGRGEPAAGKAGLLPSSRKRSPPTSWR